MGCNTRDTSILPNTTKNIFLQQPAFNLPVRLGAEMVDQAGDQLLLDYTMTVSWVSSFY